MEQKILSVLEMREADAYTIANHTDGRELMRRAGEAIFQLVEQEKSWRGKIAIVCGSGNNAGDGYVLASRLFDIGNPPLLILLKEKFSKEGKYYFDLCREKGIEYILYSEDTELGGFDIIVDCIYGTGFQGELKKEVAELIRKINASSAYIISADINSGMNGDSPNCELCVRSDLTVSIGFLKIGQVGEEAKRHMKKLCLAKIGIMQPPLKTS
ncbi:MAG: NAD(P)H-hydrate epimerase [Johnsonella sp.]|nr:NAD(P)H-hydrate epimerase [Johnsonella sp.]